MNLTYEQATKRLEEIITKLEQGTISLDESMQLYEEGVILSDFCLKKLETAKQKIININEVKNDDWYKIIY